MLDPATARLCVWRLPLEAAFRLFSKLGSLGGSIRERFSRTGRTRPALARPAFSRWLLENDRLRERWPCQWLNVLYFPFSETSPSNTGGICEAPKNSTVPNPKDTKKKHPKGCFFASKNNTKYRYRRETKKSQCNHKLAIEVVTTGGYNVTTDGYRVKT